MKQRTIKEPFAIEGIGLQTGQRSVLRLRSSPVNSGINFIRIDLPNKPLLNIQTLDLSQQSGAIPAQRTTLGMGPLQIQTTEHFLAALAGLSIDNIVVEMSGAELPGLDGSAQGFVEAMVNAQIIEQDEPKKIFKVDRAVWCEDKGSFLGIFPCDDLKVSYTLSYADAAIGTQFLSIVINEESFKREISPARTFCLEQEAIMLLKMGLGKGANYDNTLVIGKEGPVGNKFRFSDEPVRHKILDLLGDLLILGRAVKGHVVAIKSGHKMNMELVKKLKALVSDS